MAGEFNEFNQAKADLEQAKNMDYLIWKSVSLTREVHECIERVGSAEIGLITAQGEYQAALANLWDNGWVTGKNEKERDAEIRSKIDKQVITSLEDAEIRVVRTKSNRDQMLAELKNIHYLMRLAKPEGFRGDV